MRQLRNARWTLSLLLGSGIGFLALAVGSIVIGIEWAIAALVPVLVTLALWSVRKLRRELSRLERAATAREESSVHRWQQARGADRARLRELQHIVEQKSETIDSRLDVLERSQNGAYMATLGWLASERRKAESSATLVEREREIEKIRASTLFDAAAYQRQLGMRLADPVTHYVDYGALLGLEPHPLFVTRRYLERHPDALQQWRTPLGHFLAAASNGCHPDSVFVAYDDEGSPLEADMKWAYLAAGWHTVPNTFILYRILGNDLPPRHLAGQTIANLKFILAHEQPLERCQKRWVINRITDPEIEKEIIQLLDGHNAEYLRIPFEVNEYREVGWNFVGISPPGLTYRTGVDALSEEAQEHALDHIYHNKNLYVMNNNGARNAALKEGREHAKWVLPFDGNCYFTPSAWHDVLQAVDARPYLKYFMVPMARVTDNALLLEPGRSPKADEEPQLVFRTDAQDTFDPQRRYGRRPKVELLYRLRVRGPWDTWGRTVWDAPHPAASVEAKQVGTAGWVARLSSGQPHLEADSRSRQWGRVAAIRESIDRIDETIIRETFDAAAPIFLSLAELHRQRSQWQSGDGHLKLAVEQLLSCARQVSKRKVPTEFDEASNRISVKTFAGVLTGDEQHLYDAGQLLRRLTRQTGRRQLRRRGAPSRLKIPSTTHDLLDMARLLERNGVLGQADTHNLQDWCSQRLRFLDGSAEGVQARGSLGHMGTWYDVEVTAICAYINDIRGLLTAIRRAHERIGQQFEPDGSQQVELAGAHPHHGCLLNMQGWTQLASITKAVGQDLWGYRTDDGSGLSAAFQWTLGLGADPADATPGATVAERQAVLVHKVAAGAGGILPHRVGAQFPSPWASRQVFPTYCGIRPFWWLGQEGSGNSSIKKGYYG